MSILDKDAALEEMKEDRMPGILGLIGGKMPSDNSIWRALVASEGEVARKIGVLLEPTEIFPMVPPTEAELAALGGKPWAVDPGYDMEGGMLGTFRWASIQLRQRPILAIRSVKFVYPTINTPIYDVPLEWVYPDHKAGLIQFTPKPTASGMAPSILGANMMASGGAVPQMVRVRYCAGLDPTHPRMPEILDLIMRKATLRHLKFLPQSASISADGLTQSKSFDVDKFADAIEKELGDLRQSIRGPIWSVL